MIPIVSRQLQRGVNLARRNLDHLTWSQLRYHSRRSKAITRHQSFLPSLSARDRLLLQALRQDGIAITSLEELQLPKTDEFLAAAAEVQRTLSQSSLNGLHQHEFLLTASASLLASQPSLFTWGLQPRLLNLVECYQQLPVAYHGVYLRRDLARGRIVRSRLWHTDMEDEHTLKVIVYLHAMDEQSGPFQYLPKSITQGVQEQLGGTCGYIRPGRVEQLVSPQRWRSCTGPRGTVILVDTGSLIHRGAVPQRDDRYAIFFDYTSRLPQRPYYCKSSLSPVELEQVTEGLSPAQKACIWWRAAQDKYQNEPKSSNKEALILPARQCFLSLLGLS